MEVRYQAKSGGFRELRNIDRQNQHYRTDSYIGLEDVKEVRNFACICVSNFAFLSIS